MWALDVIGIMRNVELCQTLYEISDSRWSCSAVELPQICSSGAVFFRVGALSNTP
jgi:hypothetical protein